MSNFKKIFIFLIFLRIKNYNYSILKDTIIYNMSLRRFLQITTEDCLVIQEKS